MYTREEIIKRFIEKHGDRYDYSKVEYTKLINPVEIICKKHGSFFQSPHSHLKGQGCPRCGIESRTEKKKDTRETFINKAIKVHGNKYDYSKVEYAKSNKKVCIICQKHGEFYQKPNCHLNGEGCPLCANETRDNNRRMTLDEFIRRSNEIHDNKYDYSKVEYKNSTTKVCIICPVHGEFYQIPHSHLIGKGCKKCGNELRGRNRVKTIDQFIEDAKKVHGDKYDYSKVNYTGCFNEVEIICPKHGSFFQKPAYHLSGNGCQLCGMEMSPYSQGELDLFNFINSIVPGRIILQHDHRILDGDELDIYIPSLNIAFEYDGLYWHNEINKPDYKYHLKKTEKCLEKGVRLIHIFEDEWINKNEICKSRIKNILGVTNDRIYARKCSVELVNSKLSRDFLNNNHIQGYANSKINYGLYYNNELVALMTFSKLRKNLGSKSECGKYELLRFCNKLDTTVIGGAAKLFKHFIKDYNPDSVISYADRRWSNGNLYNKLNFVLIDKTKPSYFYIIDGKRKNRFEYRKDILISKYGCKKEETEHSFCLSKNWYRIYDCGTMKFEYTK